jgi:methyl-accepting chemotaxis protein
VKKLSFKAKLISTVGFVWLSLILLCVLNALSTRHMLMQQRETALAEQVQSAMSIVRFHVKEAQGNKVSEADSNMLQLLNPVRPETENKINDLVDRTGKHFTAEIVKHGLDGTHLTSYLYPKPGQSEPLPKVAYGDYVREWDWHVYTGAYIDDIDRAFYAIVLKSLAIVFAIGAVLTFAMAFIIRGVLRSIGGDPGQAAVICGVSPTAT